MRSVMVIGVGPLPAPHAERVYAPGLRLNAFVNAFLASGRKVYLGELEFSGKTSRKFEPRRDVDAHRLFDQGIETTAAEIQHWVKEREPEVMVALTDVGALAAVYSGFLGPLYVDYFGHPMAERQQQAAVHESNASLAEQWLNILPVLMRADKFSVCSSNQRYALLGELGPSGRLNAETSGYDFVDIIPPSLPFTEPLPPPMPNYFDKHAIPSNARIIFSSGGFNTWMDEETLFSAVEAILRQEPTFHFACTGGAIEGHVNIVFEKFQRRVQQSSFRDRYHFLGWLPHHELFDAMQNAHVAVNCDLPVLEGELGCRNRILGWLWAGLRVVSTISSSPAIELSASGKIRGVPCRDWKSLAQAITEEAHKGRFEQDLPEMQKQLLEEWGPQRCHAPLLTWIDSPTVAPDRLETSPENPLIRLQHEFIHMASQRKVELNIRRKARELGKRLQGSRAIRTYCNFNPDMEKILNELCEL